MALPSTSFPTTLAVQDLDPDLDLDPDPDPDLRLEKILPDHLHQRKKERLVLLEREEALLDLLHQNKEMKAVQEVDQLKNLI